MIVFSNGLIRIESEMKPNRFLLETIVVSKIETLGLSDAPAFKHHDPPAHDTALESLMLAQ